MKFTIYLFLGIFIGLLISTHLTRKQVACMFDSWENPSDLCTGKALERGNKVKLKSVSEKTAKFYNNCEVTYIAGVALENHNEVWVLLHNCDFQKGAPAELFLDPMTDIFPLDSVEKIK